MPIYAYRCGSCGFAKDVLQKLSDAQLTLCPSCGADTFSKQVTAAGFQLKGSGWYVTDFRGGNTGASAPPAGEGKAPEGGPKSESAAGAKTETAPGNAPATGSASAKAETSAPAPAPAPKPDKGL
jgi:putative FmdB family regulatory protein